jgi:hypothetical protein
VAYGADPTTAESDPTMMKLCIPTAVALLAALLPAQNAEQDKLVELRAQKLAKPVFQKAPWVTDYDKAREQAKKENKLIFAYFTRSYAR